VLKRQWRRSGCNDDGVGLVIVVLIGIAALTGVAVILGMADSPLAPAPIDRLDDGLPDRRLTSHDVGGLRFRTGLRGYRMDEVDRALDRLRDALHDAEARAAELELAVAASKALKPARPRKAATQDPPSRSRARKSAASDEA
jgi:DivIVA domain-containing protein